MYKHLRATRKSLALNGYFEQLDESHYKVGITALEHSYGKCISLFGDYMLRNKSKKFQKVDVFFIRPETFHPTFVYTICLYNLILPKPQCIYFRARKKFYLFFFLEDLFINFRARKKCYSFFFLEDLFIISNFNRPEIDFVWESSKVEFACGFKANEKFVSWGCARASWVKYQVDDRCTGTIARSLVVAGVPERCNSWSTSSGRDEDAQGTAPANLADNSLSLSLSLPPSLSLSLYVCTCSLERLTRN